MSKHTPGPWIAIKGDTFNRERPWGVSKYLSREAHIEIDGTDEDYPTRTEVIAELTETQDPHEVEYTAYLIAAAPAMYEALSELVKYLREEVADEALDTWAPVFKAAMALAQAEGRQT